MKQEKPIAVYGAIAANLAIAAMKFVVSFITGSSAMLAEAIHSTADTGNELLLLLGLKRSKKPADDLHPLGHGRELYFWSLIVAILLFGAGAGMSLYEGITNLSHAGTLSCITAARVKSGPLACCRQVCFLPPTHVCIGHGIGRLAVCSQEAEQTQLAILFDLRSILGFRQA